MKTLVLTTELMMNIYHNVTTMISTSIIVFSPINNNDISASLEKLPSMWWYITDEFFYFGVTIPVSEVYRMRCFNHLSKFPLFLLDIVVDEFLYFGVTNPISEVYRMRCFTHLSKFPLFLLDIVVLLANFAENISATSGICGV